MFVSSLFLQSPPKGATIPYRPKAIPAGAHAVLAPQHSAQVNTKWCAFSCDFHHFPKRKKKSNITQPFPIPCLVGWKGWICVILQQYKGHLILYEILYAQRHDNGLNLERIRPGRYVSAMRTEAFYTHCYCPSQWNLNDVVTQTHVFQVLDGCCPEFGTAPLTYQTSVYVIGFLAAVKGSLVRDSRWHLDEIP